MPEQQPNQSTSFLQRIPSFVWVIVVVIALAAAIGGIASFSYAMMSLQGFASLGLILGAWFLIRAYSRGNASQKQLSGIAVAILITFFASMGTALDQAGNPIYNKPIEWIFCASESAVRWRNKSTLDLHSTGMRIRSSHGYVCQTGDDPSTGTPITDWKVHGLRFVEYVLLGYALLYLNRLYIYWRRRASAAGA